MGVPSDMIWDEFDSNVFSQEEQLGVIPSDSFP